MNKIKRGEIYYANLNNFIGSEQGGVRPVVILQNDTGNLFSHTTIVAAITSKIKKTTLPTHVPIYCEKLRKNSIAMTEQIRTIDKDRLLGYVGMVDRESMEQIDKALEISFGLSERRI